MSGLAVRREDGFEGPAWLRGPLEGWLALAALAVMVGCVATAIDAAHWAGFVPDGPSETAFLLPLMLVAATWGFASAKLGWPALAADVAGAVIGALVLLVAVAGVVSPAPGLGARLTALSDSVYLFYHDLVIEGVRSSQTSVFLLVLGAALFTVAQLAAFNLFRRRRGLTAVGLLGLALFIELSVSALDQYGYLIIFSLGALLLLMRLNLLEQRAGWARRGIGDQGAVVGLYTRSGSAFIALTLVGALVLTATASSAPLAGVLDQPALRDQLVQLGEQLNTVVGGVVGNARGPNGLFASSSTITGLWESSSSVVFYASTSTGKGYYWQGATYDTFDGTTWKQVDRTSGGQVAPGGSLLGPAAEELAPSQARLPVETTVTNVNLGTPTLVAPDDLSTADRPATVYSNGPSGVVDAAQLAGGLDQGGTYRVSSLVLPTGAEPGAPTQAELAAAGTAYPATLAPYVAYRGAVGAETVQTAKAIVAALPAAQRDPYHIAQAIQDYFLDPADGFQYQTDVRGECPSGDIVDCFLVHKAGYCEFFASAMVMMLRTQGIPARYVKGYLPGQRLADGRFEVAASAAHAWAQAYFPGFGWITFDPTPGGQADLGQTAASFVPGSAVPTATATVGPVLSGAGATDPRHTLGPLTGPTTGPRGPDTSLLAVLLIAMLALVVVLGAWRSRRAAARRDLEPDAVFRGLVGFATRLGYAQLPTQTAYEYAGALGELVPAAREELQLVARAKVEGTYARRPFQGERLAAVQAAYRRARVRLLRLLFRRRRGFRTGR